MAIELLHSNPFNLSTALFAKHAQHVVLVHFPIAMFISAVAFDVAGYWTSRQSLLAAGYYNLAVAAISIPAVVTTGLLAWRFQLEGQKLHGVLLLHLVFACASGALIALVWFLHFRERRHGRSLRSSIFAIEILAVGALVIAGYLGGVLSGVNRAG